MVPARTRAKLQSI